MKVGAKIKKIRVAKNYSQKHMANVLDISQGYYNKIENGQANISVEKLVTIARELEVDPGQLVSSDEHQYINTLKVKNGQIGSGNFIYQTYSEKERQLYLEQIKVLKEESVYLKGIIDKFKIKMQ